MDVRSELRKTAIDECIDSLKIEVKKKIDVILGSTLVRTQQISLRLPQITPLFVKKKSARPENASWNACAIIPGRKLLRK